MKQIALTLLTLLLLLGTVFAAPSITIISPNGGEIIKGNYNIIFDLVDFNWIDLRESSVDLINVPAGDLNSSITNTYQVNSINCTDNVDRNTCYFLWNTPQKEDGNWKIRVIIRNNNNINDKEKLSANPFTIDNTPPSIFYNFPDNNKWINPEMVLFSFILNDVTSGVDENSIIFSIGGNDYNIHSEKVDYNSVSGIVDFNSIGIDFNNNEMYSLTIDLNDLAKNNSIKDLNFWIDKNAPSITDFNVVERTNNQKPTFGILAQDQIELSGLNKMYFSCNSTNWKSANYSTNYSDFNIIDSTYGCNNSDGNKTIYFRVQDHAGNYSSIIDKNIYYDTSAPTLIITKSDNNLWTDSPVSVDINCFDNSLTTINYWLNGNLTTTSGNYANIIVNQDKNNELIYSCLDDLLNTDGNHYTYIGIDINGPYPLNFSLPIAQNDKNITLSWTETNLLSDINYFIWGKISSDNNFNLIFGPTTNQNYIDSNTLVDQNYCYFIQTINQFGRDTNSETNCVLIDQNSPIITINPTASISTNNITITVIASDGNGSGIKGYYYSKDKNNWVYDASSSYTFTSLPNNTYTFFVIATDYADNNSLDKNVLVSLNYSPPSGGGGSSGGSIRGGTISITNKDINEIILEEEVEETVSLPQVVDSNVKVESTQNFTDTNEIIEEPITGTGLFGLDNLIRISFWPILLIIGLFLILLILAKRRKKEDNWGSDRILVEDDISNMKVNMWSGKWGYKK